MMRSVEIESPAKINWFLHIGERRADGFHELETVFQEIDLADSITVTEARATSIDCEYPGVPADATNLAWRAWEALRERYGIPPVRITIAKNIPPEGGLAGGSSNAATVLRALVTMFDVQASEDEIARIALSLGSDVPFFLVRGTAYARGRGEILTPAPTPAGGSLLLIFPPDAVSTARAFAMLAATRKEDRGVFIGRDDVIALMQQPIPQMIATSRNDLEAPAVEIAPSIAQVMRDALEAHASAVRMSGSGSTVWASFESDAGRDLAAERLAGSWKVAPVSAVPR